MTRILFLPNSHTLLWLDATQSPQEILNAVSTGVWLPPTPYENLSGSFLSAHLQDGIITITHHEDAPTQPQSPLRLSPRQREVLNLLAEGLTTQQIARRLHLQPRSILYHIATMKNLLNAQTRAELIHKAALLR
jgi:DNA-binding NarL/FixJ family response regulator